MRGLTAIFFVIDILLITFLEGHVDELRVTLTQSFVERLVGFTPNVNLFLPFHIPSFLIEKPSFKHASRFTGQVVK